MPNGTRVSYSRFINKATLEKWVTVSLSPIAIAKVMSILSVVGNSPTLMDNEQEEYDVSYSETDSSHF